jgi:hypothetical protein
MDIGWMIDLHMLYNNLDEKYPTQTQSWLAGWLAIALQQKSYWGHNKDCINLSLALSFVVVVVCLFVC